MKTLLIAFLCCLLSSSFTSAQQTYASQDTVYRRSVENALTLLKKGDCQTCLNQYQRAFTISQKSALSKIRAAACAYQCGQSGLANKYVQEAIILDWWGSEDVLKNKIDYPELNPLRVGAMDEFVQKELDKQKIAAGLNPILIRELEQIFNSDKQPRLRADTVAKRVGFNAPEMQPIYAEMQLNDSINVIKIVAILEKHGYPGKKVVGDRQSSTAWLVIQHAPLALQEKYLPLMQKAADQGELNKSSLALLIDRIRNKKGQKQLYGSQVHMGADGKPDGFEPIEDEPNVNKRRQSMNLPPLEEYAKHWGIEYVLPKQ